MVQQMSTATCPPSTDFIRPKQTCELHQRPASTPMQLVHTEEVVSDAAVACRVVDVSKTLVPQHPQGDARATGPQALGLANLIVPSAATVLIRGHPARRTSEATPTANRWPRLRFHTAGPPRAGFRNDRAPSAIPRQDRSIMWHASPHGYECRAWRGSEQALLR